MMVYSSVAFVQWRHCIPVAWFERVACRYRSQFSVVCTLLLYNGREVGLSAALFQIRRAYHQEGSEHHERSIDDDYPADNLRLFLYDTPSGLRKPSKHFADHGTSSTDSAAGPLHERVSVSGTHDAPRSEHHYCSPQDQDRSSNRPSDICPSTLPRSSQPRLHHLPHTSTSAPRPTPVLPTHPRSHRTSSASPDGPSTVAF